MNERGMTAVSHDLMRRIDAGALLAGVHPHRFARDSFELGVRVIRQHGVDTFDFSQVAPTPQTSEKMVAVKLQKPLVHDFWKEIKHRGVAWQLALRAALTIGLDAFDGIGGYGVYLQRLEAVRINLTTPANRAA